MLKILKKFIYVFLGLSVLTGVMLALSTSSCFNVKFVEVNGDKDLKGLLSCLIRYKR